MRLLVYHNPSAGHDVVPREVLIKELQRAGHEVVWVEKGAGKLSDVLAQPFDAVMVVGGDGSVGAVGRELAGRPQPIAVLPAGTANNVATLLGVTQDNVMRVLAVGHTIPFDVGVIESATGRRLFLESVGVGPFADTVAILSSREGGPQTVTDRADELNRDLHVLAECVSRYAPCVCRLDLDDEEVTGTLLMVEITNSGLFGPNLRLAPEAVPFDGLLDVAIIDVTERDELLGFVEAKKQSRTAPPAFTIRRARRVRLRLPPGRRLHIDGESADYPEAIDVTITIQAGALRFFVAPEVQWATTDESREPDQK